LSLNRRRSKYRIISSTFLFLTFLRKSKKTFFHQNLCGILACSANFIIVIWLSLCFYKHGKIIGFSQIARKFFNWQAPVSLSRNRLPHTVWQSMKIPFTLRRRHPGVSTKQEVSLALFFFTELSKT
jgi:hypothetical protein